MKHIKLFENDSKIDFLKDFSGVKLSSRDAETNKKITKLAKEHKMFLLATHSGVKYFISESQEDIKAFKENIQLI